MMAVAATNHPLVWGHPPAWASSWGQDRCGVWVAFTINEIEQRMRWIPPGSFLMGSPLHEKQREDDEIAHEVSITQGFWLAATACTQALYQAVTGENPGHFRKNLLQPVEQVSWHDCNRFIDQINTIDPRLRLRLPSEAEWEYACRAGTTTPFSFGSTITTGQVNYDGNHPYGGGEKGAYRAETVAVASLPANAWGLYEMHGNVLEWCEDWYGPYPSGSQVDPIGSTVGTSRVLRGGSWISDGRHTRAAYRFYVETVIRIDYAGFRLARGQG